MTRDFFVAWTHAGIRFNQGAFWTSYDHAVACALSMLRGGSKGIAIGRLTRNRHGEIIDSVCLATLNTESYRAKCGSSDLHGGHVDGRSWCAGNRGIPVTEVVAKS